MIISAQKMDPRRMIERQPMIESNERPYSIDDLAVLHNLLQFYYSEEFSTGGEARFFAAVDH
jgi:hypothetical protein